MADKYNPSCSANKINGNCAVKQLDKEVIMKPEKVKSRWRRNSEMEMEEPSSVIPEMSSENSLKCCVNNQDMSIDFDNLPPFELLEDNLYLFERRRSKRKKEGRRMHCECSVKPNEVACGDQCLNRLLMIECGSKCVTGEACSNRRFEKRLYVKTQPFKTEKKGYGLKVLEDVPKGSFIIEYVGEVLNRAEFKKRVKYYARERERHYYFMALKIDEIIDARFKANVSRFINHSCNPNCETQKWTVNGELRIGFFAKHNIKANEELTFDYKLERYGRQAQKCYCESKNCKGYIGMSDEITVAVDTKKESKSKRKKNIEKEEKKKDILEDLTMEEEIAKLSINAGLRNKEDTLMLARLMVRAEDSYSREKLLDIILGTTEAACLRLFLDYHGLTLFWSWMADLKNLTDFSLKKKILKALSLLPVPNRTVLSDSKVLSVVEKWASCSVVDVEHESTKIKSCDTSDSETERIFSEAENLYNSERDRTHFSNRPINGTETISSVEKTGEDYGDAEEFSCDNKILDSNLRSDEESGDNNDEKNGNLDSRKYIMHTAEIVTLAQNLLDSWKDLKEIFRIPKREKKYEEEHCRSSSELSTAEVKNINMKQNIKGNFEEKFSVIQETIHEEKIKVVESIYGEHIPSRSKRTYHIKVMEAHERKRIQNNCTILYQHDSSSDYSRSENYKYLSPVFTGESDFHHSGSQYIQPLQHNESHLYDKSTFAPESCLLASPGTLPSMDNDSSDFENYKYSPPIYSGESNLNYNELEYIQPLQHKESHLYENTTCTPQPPLLPSPGTLPSMDTDSSDYSQSEKYKYSPPVYAVESNFHQNGFEYTQPLQHNESYLYEKSTCTSQPPPLLPSPGTLSNVERHPSIICVPPPPIPVTAAPPVLPNVMFPPPSNQMQFLPPLTVPPPVPKHPVAIGPYPQSNNLLTIPPIVGMPGTPSPIMPMQVNALSSKPVEYPVSHNSALTYPPAQKNEEVPRSLPFNLPPNWKTAKDSEGNVYFYHIKTRHSQWNPPIIAENKDVASTSKHESKGRKRHSHTRRSHKKKHSKKKATTAAADTSSREVLNGDIAKKIRELFRTKMSSYVVQCLNPYRKDDCKVGRITSNEDFKHLARKLTHFVMAKELKHCKNIEDLDANESVKLKAKDYIRKYMDRYGPVYKKE